ncbi:unnamed protein product [Choristocarpus tenellus]
MRRMSKGPRMRSSRLVGERISQGIDEIKCRCPMKILQVPMRHWGIRC